MTTPEDLAKAEQIVRKHCGANIRATGPTVTDDDWEPGYAGLRDTIAAALAESYDKGVSDTWAVIKNTPKPKPAAEVVEAKEGYVRTSDGVVRKLIGTLAVTKDGAVVCDGEEVWHPEQDMSFHLKVMSLYGDMRPEPDDEFPLPDDCTHMGHYSYYERDTGYSQYESRDVRECYSTKEAALAAQSARDEVG